MNYPADTESKVSTDATYDQPPVLDGTANLDYSDDDEIPRIKGLIELLTQYFENRYRWSEIQRI